MKNLCSMVFVLEKLLHVVEITKLKFRQIVQSGSLLGFFFLPQSFLEPGKVLIISCQPLFFCKENH